MTPQQDLRLPKRTLAELRSGLPAVADRTVTAIIEEVPSYSDALSGPMGATIRDAVQLGVEVERFLRDGRGIQRLEEVASDMSEARRAATAR